MSGNGSTEVTFWYDYSCPFCYFGLVRLDTLAKELHFSVDRRPYLLRPDSSVVVETLTPHEPAIRRSPSTALAHEATAYAKELGLDGQFHHAAAGAYWLAGADLGSLYVLRDLSVACGLDWPMMRQRLESHHYREFVVEEHQAAIRRGVTGTPSYLIGGRMYAGDVSLEALRVAIEGTQ